MNLLQPYYIEPREDKSHFSLDGIWDFTWSDTECNDLNELSWKHTTTLPKSVYHSLHEAGVLPDPYAGTNSKLYHWVDEKIWYYRKRFTVSEPINNKRAFLCFDGVAYYSRLWVNGILCGTHEGMFGGPVCDVTNMLNCSGDNEIIIEVKACNYGCKDSFEFMNRDEGKNTQLVPWNIVRDDRTSNGDMIVIGVWNGIRLEILDEYHISRPYLYTKLITENSAILHLEMEITDGTISELHEYYGYNDDCYSYTRAYDTGLTGATKDKSVRIVTEIIEPDTCKVAYTSVDEEYFLDYEKLMMDPSYHELQYVTKEIKIENPRLWYPHGMGEPFLYDVRISLYDGERLCDSHTLQTGIRSVSTTSTTGRKYRHRWEDFLFTVNGKEVFIKGMNWTPIDFLYSISPKEYEWCLRLAKNAGIQLLRVWNGGGFPETDTFYNLCDKLGIMVWQDLMIANTTFSQNYSHTLIESQIAYNLYRIRNHASLVLLCGGNEFNPYTVNNAAAMFVQSRVCRDLAPHVLYHYTTSDKGSAHIYLDIEPVWFRHVYQELPFLAEAGIHSLPAYATWKKLLPAEELNRPLPSLVSKEFQEQFPSLLNHFTEFIPERVPRLLSRASQIVNLDGVSLHDLCEASQVQAYEFYSLMIQAMRENFPRCGGIMPWVFKRPWTTAGIQVVDGTGHPGIPYYAVQKSYKDLAIIWRVPWSMIAPREPLSLDVIVLNDKEISLDGCLIRLTIYRPDMTVEQELVCSVSQNEREYSFGQFFPDDRYTDTCFVISAELLCDSKVLAASDYFIKCTSILENKELYEKYRSKPCENLYFERGPWLKSGIQSARQTRLGVTLEGQGTDGSYPFYDIEIKNIGEVAAYPVTVHFKEDASRHFESDNFFLLRAGEKRRVRIFTDDDKTAQLNDIKVSAWNVARNDKTKGE